MKDDDEPIPFEEFVAEWLSVAQAIFVACLMIVSVLVALHYL